MKQLFALSVLGLGAALVVSACGSNESTTGPDEHDPARVTWIVDGDTLTGDTLYLPAGQVVTVRGIFYNFSDSSLDDVEGQHWSKLTFVPGTLATAAVDVAHHYSHTVTVSNAAATGTVDVGFGHDSLADEHTLHSPVVIQ